MTEPTEVDREKAIEVVDAWIAALNKGDEGFSALKDRVAQALAEAREEGERNPHDATLVWDGVTYLDAKLFSVRSVKSDEG